jgi:alanine or glycine:cation symporter, AGCS family
MYVLKRGWGDHAGPFGKAAARALGSIFCVTLFIATMTGGNMFQSWNVADITRQYFNVPSVVTGLILAVATGVVIIGGIKRIGDVAGYLVPIMCGIYMVAGIVVLIVEAANVPSLLWLIVKSAFSPTEAAGAFLGATTWFGLTTGLRRALFSNEAGQGTSPIAHCAAKTTEPVREGVVAGLEPFIDTCVVCTLTALVILATGTWNRAPLGDFAGEPGVDTNIAALPAQQGDVAWQDTHEFYLIAETPAEQQDTGSKAVRLNGKVVRGESGLSIEWGSLPEGAIIKDRGVHRQMIGSAMTGLAFDRAVPGLGKYLVTLTCWLFGYATLISWSYYGEQASVFLFGPKAALPYKFIFCLGTVGITFPNLISTDTELGNLSDLGTGCMLFANVPIIWVMGYRAIAALRDYFTRLDSGQMRPAHAAPPIIDVIEGRDVE